MTKPLGLETTTAKNLTVTQAKKIPADGSQPTYYYSLPKIRLWDFKGWKWLWRRMKAYKAQREFVGRYANCPLGPKCPVCGTLTNIIGENETPVCSACQWSSSPIARRLAVLAVLAVFTTTGKAWVVDKIQEEPVGATMPLMKWVAWGTGATAEAVGNTTLATEASEARVVAVLSQPAADTDRSVGTITANGTKTITECGRFNQLAVGGTMQQRSLFTGIPMVLNDRIEFTQDLQVT